MKFYRNGQWFTELGFRIKCNDLLNGIKDALAAYQELHQPKKPRLTHRRPRRHSRQN